MGKRFLRSIVQPFQTLTASLDITPLDLPVNPLSFLVLTLRATEVATGVAARGEGVPSFASMVPAASVRHKGENIFQGSLTDLAALNIRVAGMNPWGHRMVTTTGAIRSMSFPLSFSRRPYWHDEGFPATSRGNLQLFMTAAALPTFASAMSWQLESVELIEDNPRTHLKYITNTKALTATGQFDASLPIGNPLVGIVLFEPSIFGTTLRQFSWGQVKLLKDNVEQYYPLSDWESLVWEMWGREANPFEFFDHQHRENLAAAYAANVDTDPQEIVTLLDAGGYGYMDFDPLMDGSYALETAGAADVKLRGFVDTGTAAATVRYLPVELVPNK